MKMTENAGDDQKNLRIKWHLSKNLKKVSSETCTIGKKTFPADGKVRLKTLKQDGIWCI